MKTSELIWQDKQHQVLLELIEQIISSNGDASIFRQLYEYAENHFSLEEEYMIKLNFPEAEEHIRAHDKFRSELESMMQEFTSYDELFRKALAEFLSEWLKGHIYGIDKKLEAFILKSPYK
ncbi:MAG: hemerythrin family protein [Gammaproteobacteria bacterium]|nr:hemerythrin family protein [Gammaproteobacteria bacterium]